MPAIAGLRGTGDWGQDERPKEFREYILWNQPNGQTPLTALMSKMGSEKLTDPEFSWWEELLTVTRVTSDATGASATSTTIGLTGGGLALVPGDLLQVEKADSIVYDNEIVEVSSVTSDTSIVVRRGQCGTVAAATGVSASFTRMSTRFAEGTGAPGSATRNPTKFYNYAQIFKTAYEITRTADQTTARTGNARQNDKKRKAHDHAVTMELAYFFGRRHETVGANGKPMRSTGGLRSFLTSNVKVYTTTPTMNSLIDALSPMFDYTADAGNERIGFCGNGFLNGLNKLVIGQSNVRVNYDNPIKVYGMELFRIVMPQGTVFLKTHPLFNVLPAYRNSAFFIHAGGLKDRYLMKTKDQDNIQESDIDGIKGQWIAESGLEVHQQESMGYVGNFIVP